MTKPTGSWTVRPHGAPERVADRILTVVGHIHMPVGDLPRRMTAVRLAGGDLVIFSAVCLDEAGMRTLEAFGDPAFLIVPNDHHRTDAMDWKVRYPRIQVIAPLGVRAKVEQAVPVDAAGADFADPDVRLIEVPGTRAHEFALEVAGDDGLTLVLNDVVANIRGEHGFGGWLLRLMGFAGDEPHVPGPVKAAMVDDKAALAGQLRRWAAAPDLKRILVAHGETIETGASEALRRLADGLDDREPGRPAPLETAP